MDWRVIMMKVTILTNEVDCESHATYRTRIERYFRTNNIEVRNDFEVDAIIISTCGVTNKLFNMVATVINRLKEMGFKDDQIFIMGCLPKTHEQKLRELAKVWIVPFGKENILDDYFHATKKFESIKPSNIINVTEKRYLTDSKNYFGIEIEEGCLRQCTFCVINRAHGNIKSKEINTLKNQYRLALSQGYKKISLFGTDTFAYGYDNGTNIIELIKEFDSYDDTIKYKLGTAHIRWIPQLFDGFKKIISNIDLMHPAIQHVDSNVLHRMGRGESIDAEYKMLAELKEINPNVLFLTDVIVGFPGETEKAFEKLLKFFEKDQYFDFVNVFMYDDMEAAPSYKLDHKISAAQKILRYNKLNQVLRNKQSYDDHIHSINLRTSVIVDGVFHCKNSYIENE